MNSKLIILAVLAFVLLAVTPAEAQNNSTFCQGAKHKNKAVPGGWVWMTRKEIKNTTAIQTDAQTQAVSGFPNCSVKNVYIIKACEQVVSGMNYQYKARAHLKCPNNVRVTVNHFNNTVSVPAGTGGKR